MCAYMLALVALGCGGGEDRAYSRGSTVTVAVSDVTVLKPDDTDADFLVFLPLASLNANGELEGRLARSWEHSADYREWTYHLRTDVRWHDGVPVTAHDVKFTMDLLSHPDVLEYVFESVTVLDDSTVTVRAPRHSYISGIVFYPRHLLEHLKPEKFFDWEFWTRPVGNGPYRFVRHLPETMIEFEANPDYHRGKPTIERVVLKFVGKSGLTELLSGNVDAVADANPALIRHLAADPRFRVYHAVAIFGGAQAIYWQHNHPLFRDPRVRRALTMAINRRELLAILNLPDNFPLFDGPLTVRQLRRRQLPEPITFNPAKARALLDSAGWHDQDGDGVREKERGQPFRFTALAPAAPRFGQLPVYIQAQLRQVGVHMDIQTMDLGVIWERLSAGEFEAAFMVVQSSPGWYLKYFGDDSPLGYNNPEVVKLIEEAVATADPNEEDRIYHALMGIFRAEQPITYLLPWTYTFLVHRRIQGLSTPFRADPLHFMEELWLEDESAPR